MFHPTLDPQLVGEVIAARRKKKGVSQEVLSGLADIGRTHLSAIERGERKPTLETLYRIACALDVPLHTFSHQQGHLRAAEINCPMPDEYLGVHLSGGTTEILRVQTEKYSADILGGTEDIAAGQWVDRAGVAMELHFPAGPEMEALAQQTDAAHLFTVAVKGTKLYFSGAETQTKRAITEGVPRCEIARGVFVSLGRALAKAVLAAYEQTGLLDVLIAGGVSANELVKQQLRLVCAKKAPALRLHFADPQYAGDNAAGIALLAKEAGC